jgi:hypothetical protein
MQVSRTVNHALERDSPDEEVWSTMLLRNFPLSMPAQELVHRVSYKRLLQFNVEVLQLVKSLH